MKKFVKKILIKSIVLLIPFISIFSVLVIFEFIMHNVNYFELPELKKISINEGGTYYFTKSQVSYDTSKKNTWVIGDSFTQGVHCVKNNNDLISNIQKLRNDKNIVNISVAGLAPAQYIDLLHHFPIKKYDEVILILYENDIFLDKSVCGIAKKHYNKFGLYFPEFCQKLNNNNIKEKNKNTFLKSINHKIISFYGFLNPGATNDNFYTIDLLKEALVQIPFLKNYFYRNEFKSLWDDFNSEENILIREQLKYIKDHLNSLSIDPIILYYPSTVNLIRDVEKHEIWISFIDKIKSEGVKIYDPYKYLLQNSKNIKMYWSVVDKHPSCESHKIIAKYIDQALSAHYN